MLKLFPIRHKDSMYLQCISEKKRHKKGAKYKNSGVVELMSFRIEKVHTFLDYVRGG